MDLKDVVVFLEGEEEGIKLSMEKLRIDRHDIETELSEQSASYVYVDVLRARLRADREKAEAALKDTDYRLDGVVRKEAAANKEKITEAVVKARAHLHKDRKLAADRVLVAQENEWLAGSFASAYAQRKDLLVALARSRGMQMGMPQGEHNKIKENQMKGDQP